MEPTESEGPLSGLVVVACEQAVAAPLATRHLADLGARVIKVERPDGGDFARAYDRSVLDQSSHFVWLNRNKQSLVADLKDPASLAMVEALVDRADVFVQNLAPGAADRLGLGAARLRSRNPSLVHCTISGYGPDGPYREAKAYDLLIQCETGLVEVTGTEAEPAKAGIPCADLSAGMYALSSILAALHERNRTGRGAELHVSLFDSLTEWMGYPALYSHGGSAPPRTGVSHAAIAPYGSFTTAGGHAVVLAIQNAGEWDRFCRIVLDRPDLIDHPDWATNSARVANRASVDSLVARALGSLEVERVEQLLTEAEVAHARRRSPASLHHHPQLVATGRLVPVATPNGEVDLPRAPFGWVDRDLPVGAVPALGEHTEAIRAELGAAGTPDG